MLHKIFIALNLCHPTVRTSIERLYALATILQHSTLCYVQSISTLCRMATPAIAVFAELQCRRTAAHPQGR